jgi:D-aminoacyl-tRNA deacylase
MKLVIQRVSNAKVSINNIEHAKIGAGLLILVGIHKTDTNQDVTWLTSKTANMRIFKDAEGKMNLSAIDANAEILAISQFTLFAKTAKGNRPSFIEAAKPDVAIKLYDDFCEELSKSTRREIKKGVFGADMQVELLNDGPVTIIIDSKQKE